ncbi:hypothetical protein PFX98_03750 [Paucibacter sediminis]|uniref:AsmA family protein n=1 Tax=Paucibacter sediminis TaxID=3019553 RepID=A0AA95NHV6_9BURK|nr:hypothetical protein [Paucibacter sp. S2-9]WIT12738.1 hypothetical protein PFX98_03750 [Paucibacter sp. S2-9]
MKPRSLALVALCLLLALGAAGLFWLRGNLDRLVRDAIVGYGSQMTQAPVRLGAVKLSAGDGLGVLRELSIGNPAGFKTAHALRVEQIAIAVDLASLTREVVLIRQIELIAPDLIYEKAGGRTNFDALQANIAQQLGASGGAPARDGKPGKRFIVESFALRKARAQVSAGFLQGNTVSIALPDISLRDIGKAQGGLTADELGQVIAQAINRQLRASISFDKLLKSTESGLESVGRAVKGLFK